MSDSVRISVKTNEMRQVASDLESKITASKTAFEELDKLVVRYWEGAGETEHINVYNKKLDVTGPYIQAFFDSVNNLRTIAGIYDDAEKAAIETVEELPTDVID